MLPRTTGWHRNGLGSCCVDIIAYKNRPFSILLMNLTGGFLLLQNFSVAISVSPHVCFILVLILISMFLR